MPAQLHILCVDDEDHVLRTLERFCRNEGIAMYGVSSAADALELMERERVDIVLSDYQMPGMNGLDFLQHVHARWPQVARIIISGSMDLPVIKNAIQQGDIMGFVPKPWQREVLKGLIFTATERRRVSTDKGALFRDR